MEAIYETWCTFQYIYHAPFPRQNEIYTNVGRDHVPYRNSGFTSGHAVQRISLTYTGSACTSALPVVGALLKAGMGSRAAWRTPSVYRSDTYCGEARLGTWGYKELLVLERWSELC